MRSQKEINDTGIRALVDALGREDAQRFLAQFRASTGSAAAGATAPAEADPLPPMTVDEAHQTIRDMQDPMDQQHML